MDFGPAELLFVLALVLLFWGPGKLPEIGKSLGKSISEFRRGLRQETSNDKT